MCRRRRRRRRRARRCLVRRLTSDVDDVMAQGVDGVGVCTMMGGVRRRCTMGTVSTVMATKVYGRRVTGCTDGAAATDVSRGGAAWAGGTTTIRDDGGQAYGGSNMLRRRRKRRRRQRRRSAQYGAGAGGQEQGGRKPIGVSTLAGSLLTFPPAHMRKPFSAHVLICLPPPGYPLTMVGKRIALAGSP